MYCSHCGNKIPENSAFCPFCGSAISKASTLSALNAHIERKGFKKKKRKVFAVVSFFLILIVGTGVGIFFFLSGKAEFIGITKGTGLTEEEAEQILLGDISDKEWEIFDSTNEILAEIAGQYTDEEGYIAKGEEEAVINAVTEKVDEFYEEGIITWYMSNEEGVYFEYSSGVSAFYAPEQEGTASGSGDMEILAFCPFENEKNDKGKSKELNQAIESGEDIVNSLDETELEYYMNEEITVSLLKNLPESDVFLWNGHGAYYDCLFRESYPVLSTRQPISDRTGMGDLSSKEITARINDIITDYWCITPHFVEKHFTLNEGMVYLSACQSGRNDKLAAAFVNIGAEVCFVNAGVTDVQILYSDKMLYYTIQYMAGLKDNIYYAANEALPLAEAALAEEISDQKGVYIDFGNGNIRYFATLSDYKNGVQGGTQAEVRGDGNYTLVPCIRGTVSFEDGVTENEIANITETLSVELETKDGEFVKSTTLSSNEFNFNDLEPGDYYVSLYQNGKIVSGRQEVTVQAHRYTPVTLPYSALIPLEGYVYNTAGEPISGVSVSAELALNPVLYSANAVTDSNGYYRIEIFGMNEYTLSYTLEGYSSVENSVNVTAEMYANAQKGTATQINDVILAMKLDLTAYGQVVQQYESEYGTLSFTDASYGVSYTGVFLLELLDFDGNGTEELLIGYTTLYSDGSMSYIWPYFDVWQLEDNNPVQIYEGAIIDQSDIGKHCAFTLWNGTYYLIDGMAGYGYDLSLLKLENGAFKTDTTLKGDEDQGYTVNGKSVSSDAFYQTLNQIQAGEPYYYHAEFQNGCFCGSIYEDSNYTADSLSENLNAVKELLGLEKTTDSLSVYADVIRQYEDTYGTIDYNVYYQNQADNTGETYMLKGVCLLVPIDFDGDSVSELLIGYGETTDEGTGFTKLYADVWGLNGETPTLLYEKASFPGESYFNAIAYKEMNGVYYLLDGETGDRYAETSLCSLVNGKFEKVYTLKAEFPGNTPSYTLNGAQISAAEYAGYLEDDTVKLYARFMDLDELESYKSNLSAIRSRIGLE